MEYTITKAYYFTTLKALRLNNRNANYKDVLAYFNATAGLMRKISKVRYI